MQPPKPLKPQGGELHTTDPAHGHETRDINLTGVVAFVVSLMFSGIVVFVVLWGVFHFAKRYADYLDEKDMRDPWVQRSEADVEQRAKSIRTAKNKAEEPGSMEHIDAQSRVRVSRFPQPRVQSDEIHDLAVQREAEDVYLNQYFVLDKNSGKVNIPIAQAMQRVVEKGLPAMQPTQTPAPAAALAAGAVRPSIQSSHDIQSGGADSPR